MPYEIGFQAILKAPYANLGDARVKQRREQLPAWYDWQTVAAMEQAIGRVQRAPDDHGDTYILDANALSLYQRRPTLWADWVRRQVRVISHI